MFDVYAYNTMVCFDCTMAVANYDFTGMDEETETRVRAGLARMAEQEEHCMIDYDHVEDFHVPFYGCGICGTRLAGTFYPATIEKG